MKLPGKQTLLRVAIDRRRWLQMAAASVMAGAMRGWAGAEESSRMGVLDLDNGIRIVAIEFPGSANVSVFSFLPLSLTSDGPGQAQWSHLVEHLVIRSTIPKQTATANAETLEDHMRLDTYGSLESWRDDLDHHRRWLEGVPFTEATLAAEKPKVAAECDFVAERFATHKFAVAAWSHSLRHGKAHIALKGDVARASLADLQRHRDAHLATREQVTICIAGGLKPAEALAEAKRQLGGIGLSGSGMKAGKLATGISAATWDLKARHLLMTWPAPEITDADHAALMVARLCLQVSLFGDRDLKEGLGQVLAGRDICLPEGRFAYVSATLRPGAVLEKIRDGILAHAARVAGGEISPFQVVMVAQQLSKTLKEVPDARALKLQAGSAAGQPGMLEANVALAHAMQHHLYRDERLKVADRLAAVTAADVQRVVSKWLSREKASVYSLEPAERE